MSRVRILPDDLVNLIAAGEVVERPASVVKELVENALDAGATRLTVRLKDGGRRLVSVADDGRGMGREDALLSLERHATSKIASPGDLSALATFGFRGEALSSIAAVGSFLLESWDGKEAAGVRITVEEGRILAVEEAGRPRGTTARLSGIFARIPARRKFLRTRETELAFCLRVLEEAALGALGVSFEVEGDDGVILSLPPVAGLADRVRTLWGDELGGSLLAVAGEAEGVSVSGFVSPPAVTFSRRDRQHLLVNGRPVRDPALARMTAAALAHRYPPGRHPALVLSLSLPPAEVDVNVHPAKREVRFARPAVVAAALERAFAALQGGAVLAGQSAPPGPAAGTGWGTAADRSWPLPASGPRVHPLAAAGRPGAGSGPDQEGLALGPAALKPLGQVMGTYLLAEREGALLLIDQHAAHERILYNRLLAGRQGGAARSQRLLVPAVLSLGAAERRNLLGRRGELSSLGLEVEEFGGQEVRVTAVPADLPPAAASSLVRELAGDLAAIPALPEELALAVARRACHASVRAGRLLGTGDTGRLLADLAEAEAGFACPHGRPTVVALSRADLEKLFGRR